VQPHDIFIIAFADVCICVFKATWEEEQKSHQKELDELQARVADLKVRCPLASLLPTNPFRRSVPNDLTIFVVYNVQGQNEVLHAHLQSLMSKSAQIQAAAGEVSEGYTPSGEEKTIEELRQLVGYLKKEREIVECKHELAHQEATRCVRRFRSLPLNDINLHY
jgi:hypothetical protein